MKRKNNDINDGMKSIIIGAIIEILVMKLCKRKQD